MKLMTLRGQWFKGQGQSVLIERNLVNAV